MLSNIRKQFIHCTASRPSARHILRMEASASVSITVVEREAGGYPLSGKRDWPDLPFRSLIVLEIEPGIRLATFFALKKLRCQIGHLYVLRAHPVEGLLISPSSVSTNTPDTLLGKALAG